CAAAFRKGHAQKKIERDDNSKKGHPALVDLRAGRAGRCFRTLAMKSRNASDGGRFALWARPTSRVTLISISRIATSGLARATPSGTIATPTPAATSAIAQSSDSAIAAGLRDGAWRLNTSLRSQWQRSIKGTPARSAARSLSFRVRGCDGGSAAT